MSVVDIEEIIKGDEEVIEALKENIDESLFDPEILCGNENSKYVNDLFYIAPLYHRKMINLKKILFLDTDISVQHNINEDKSNMQLGLEKKLLGAKFWAEPQTSRFNMYKCKVRANYEYKFTVRGNQSSLCGF